MITYALPAAPEGPVWDLDGSKWEKTTIGTWYTEGDEDLGWSELLNDFGPVTDIPPVKVGDVLTAALPAIEKQIREQVAAELRGELPVQLAETAGSDTGWLYDMSDWGPCQSEWSEHVDFVDENGFRIGSIDLHLIAGIAARIAKGSIHD